MAFKILVSGGYSQGAEQELRDGAGDCQMVFCADASDLAAELPTAEVVLGLVPEKLLPLAGNLKWVQSWAAGPDSQLYPDFVRHPAILTCAKGNGAIPLAEHAMMLMLMLNRNAVQWLASQRARTWDRFEHGELTGLTLGIIGTGHSGRELAQKARAFQMRVLGMRRGTGPLEGFDAMYPRTDLHGFLAECDFVVMAAPLTPESRDMLGEAEFRVMKPTAHYICFSRGGIANDDALLRALNEGWIAGAGLDAHAVEPLPGDSPFWTAPNTIVTPHNGATSHLMKARGRAIFLENLTRYRRGQALVNVVDKTAGY